jgi:hypothetical protein
MTKFTSDLIWSFALARLRLTAMRALSHRGVNQHRLEKGKLCQLLQSNQSTRMHQPTGKSDNMRSWRKI